MGSEKALKIVWKHLDDCKPNTAGADLVADIVQEHKAQLRAKGLLQNESVVSTAEEVMSSTVEDATDDDTTVQKKLQECNIDGNNEQDNQPIANNAPQRGIVCYSSKTFRNLTDLLIPSDFVLEVGCAHGMCSKEILRKLNNNPAHFMGIDTAKYCIKTCMQNLPDHNFRGLDALNEWWMIDKEVQELASAPDVHRRVVFLDIGGNREFETVVAMVRFLDAKMRFSLIVIKSEEVFVKAEASKGLSSERWLELEEEARKCFERETAEVPPVAPRKAPRRSNQDGVEFCLFHNYDPLGCKRYNNSELPSSSVCARDHTNCHRCGQPGHRGLECTEADMDKGAVAMLMAAAPSAE
mmetsp:Transcript_6953/g.13893  ORF Transcript_6953/g.13893 Transcript_6953/m.13893 type:complete len:353 (-) Transcript_6953:1630-2688(-)